MSATAPFPALRMRRLRKHDWSRRLVRENRLSPDDFIWPLFLIEGEGKSEPVAAMPGVDRLSIDRAVSAAKEAAGLGIPVIALFPHTDKSLKTPEGGEGTNPDNLVCRAVRAIKEEVPQIGVMCDVALDPYTSHGHDGIGVDGEIANDESLEILVRQALVQVEAGCDIIAPSDMMDGRIGAIRAALEQNGFTQTQLLSYAAKYASAFYGPFRDAVGSGDQLRGDKKTYQMDPRNALEGRREAALDEEEGADWLMVKPGLPYADMIVRMSEATTLPVAAYHVSGEYAMLKAASANGWLDERSCALEALLCMKRAGARAILTYYALDAARWLAD